jgi:hypothetical protein
MKLLTLIIAICLAIMPVIGCRKIRQQYTRQSENPPCHKCASLYSMSKVNDVDLRDLVHNENAYRGKILRVGGNLNNDASQLTLYPLGTNGSSGYLLADFTDPSSYAACDGVQQILYEVAGFNNWFDGTASVVVVGRLGELGHFRQGQHGFEIMCVERASTQDTKLF